MCAWSSNCREREKRDDGLFDWMSGQTLELWWENSRCQLKEHNKKKFFLFYIIAEDEKLENNTKIYLCGTLWHETISEMILMLKSIMR